MENIEDIYELTPLQQGMLFHTLLEPKSGVYVEQMSLPMSGQFNARVFMRAWQQVIDRHAILRTSFHWDDIEKPLQVVHKHVELPFEQKDWRKLPAGAQEKRLEDFLKEDRRRGFELSEAPLMRMTVIRFAEDDRELVWTFHHLLLDGWSLQLVLKDFYAFFDAAYRGEDLSLPTPRPFGDYIAWLQQQDLKRAEIFWRQALRGFIEPTPLFMGQLSEKLSEDKDEDYNGQTLWLSETTTSALQAFARENRLTMNTILQGAWAILQSRYSGESDVVFGTVVSGRPPDIQGVESMVGMFINTLPVRAQVSPDDLLPAFLERLQAHQFEARQYEYTPLVEVKSWSEVPRSTDLFQTVLVWENYPISSHAHEHEQEEEKRETRIFERLNYPLTLISGPGKELYLNVLYDCKRFGKATIDRLLGHLQTLLESFVARPQGRLFELSWLTNIERKQLLEEWNDTAAEFPYEAKCVQQLFEEQVKRTPDALAVTFDGQQLSYAELNERANKLAHHLRKIGVGVEGVVGIMMERSLGMAISVLAVLKAGGVYLPLDPQYPQERLSFMLEDAQAQALLIDEGQIDKFSALKARVLCPDKSRETIAAESGEDPTINVTPDNLAYVIYTSGSTGRPKGVAMPHRPLVNLLQWQLNRSQGVPLKTLQFSSLSFDVSFQEIFSTWCAGATLCLVTEETRRDASRLGRLLASEGIERLYLPFVALQQLAEVAEAEKKAPESLRQVITAGEQLRITSEIKSMFERLQGCVLDNQYGPTESHVVSAFELDERLSEWPKLPPIGRPIINARLHVLDRYLQPVAIGIPGELYIGGVCLARGYLGRADLTAERFVPDPFGLHPGSRLYRTGDIARRLSDGQIEFLGRTDHQVKVRGFRVELGEIEVVLAQHESVGEVAVVASQDAMGYKRLVAYVTGRNGNAPSTSEIRNYVKERLPDYMMPSAFVLLEKLPLTPSGKIDKRALPDPNTIRPELKETFTPARNEDEKILAQIWAEVLGVESVGINDSFFELGGHSLLATKLASRVRNAFQIEVALGVIFKAPTVAAMAESINKLKVNGETTIAAPITRLAREQHRVEISEGGALKFLKPEEAARQ
jgi:surfactin family lipopeptide synthetase C